MKASSPFAAVASLFIVFLLFAMGLFLVSLKWTGNLNLLICEILMYKPHVFFVFGLSLLFLGFIFLGIYYSTYHHKYLTLKVRPFLCDIDSSIISKHIEKCFEKVLKERNIDVEVYPKNEKLEVIAYLPFKEKFEEGTLIEEAKESLKKLLKKNFSYSKDFLLTFKFK